MKQHKPVGLHNKKFASARHDETENDSFLQGIQNLGQQVIPDGLQDEQASDTQNNNL